MPAAYDDWIWTTCGTSANRRWTSRTAAVNSGSDALWPFSAWIRTFSEARQGDPADVLCAVAGEQGADVLVVGSKGMDRRLRGSVPNTVSHKAPCSVLIVKTD